MEDNTRDTNSVTVFANSSKDWLMENYKTGKLPVLILLIVGVYNIIVFEIPSGYGFYILFPIIVAGILLYSKYWQKGLRYQQIGRIITFAMLLFDFILSMSYVPNPWGYSFESIPTIILDLFGMYLLLVRNNLLDKI